MVNLLKRTFLKGEHLTGRGPDIEVVGTVLGAEQSGVTTTYHVRVEELVLHSAYGVVLGRVRVHPDDQITVGIVDRDAQSAPHYPSRQVATTTDQTSYTSLPHCRLRSSSRMVRARGRCL